MASVNRVIIIGNLGKDPEVRYGPDGAAICSLNVATMSSWKDKASGEKREETEWHRVVVYGRLAEVAGEYLKKGRPAYFEGRLRTRKWQDKEGQDRYTTEIVCDNMQMLGGREGSTNEGQDNDDDHGSARRQSTAQQRGTGGGQRSGSNGNGQRQQPDYPRRNNVQAQRAPAFGGPADSDIPFRQIGCGLSHHAT